jgi:hypothetical protein
MAESVSSDDSDDGTDFFGWSLLGCLWNFGYAISVAYVEYHVLSDWFILSEWWICSKLTSLRLRAGKCDDQERNDKGARNISSRSVRELVDKTVSARMNDDIELAMNSTRREKGSGWRMQVHRDTSQEVNWLCFHRFTRTPWKTLKTNDGDSTWIFLGFQNKQETTFRSRGRVKRKCTVRSTWSFKEHGRTTSSE